MSSTASKPKMGSRAAAIDVLTKAGGPLPLKTIAERVLADYETGLKGKTPDATIAAQLYTACKNGKLVKKGEARGTFDLIDRDGTAAASEPGNPNGEDSPAVTPGAVVLADPLKEAEQVDGAPVDVEPDPKPKREPKPKGRGRTSSKTKETAAA